MANTRYVYWPAGSYLFNGSGPAIETPFIGPNEDNEYTLDIGPFNDPAQAVQTLAFVIHFEDDTWDKNNGNDYHIILDSQGIYGVTWEPDNPTQNDTIKVFVGQATQGANLHWGVEIESMSWITPDNSYWPAGTFLFGGSGPAVQSPFDGPDPQQVLAINLGPFNNPVQDIDGINFVINYNDGSWDNNGGNDYFIPITNIEPVTLDLKVFLEGPFNETGMNTSLTGEPVEGFPLNQPYNTPPWNYMGTESVTSVPPGVVDWVLVEMRDTSNVSLATGETTIASQAAFLLNDGSIVGMDGVCGGISQKPPADNFKLSVNRIRWHIFLRPHYWC